MSDSTPIYIEGEARASVQVEADNPILIDLNYFRNHFKNSPAGPTKGWNQISLSEREKRVNALFPFPLSPDVVQKIYYLPEDHLRRICNIVEALRDCLLFSDPENYKVSLDDGSQSKLYRWAVSLEVHRPGGAMNQWKQWVTFVKWKIVQSMTNEPPLPKDFPGIPRSGKITYFPHFWLKLAPWLAPIWEHGLGSKSDCTRAAHFLTTRNLPCAVPRAQSESLTEHADLLTTPFRENKERSKLLFDLSFHAGKRLRERNQISLSAAHLSVTNSASLECPINAGGRGRYIAVQFREWITRVPTEPITEVTWFGLPYRHEIGIPIWRTMCREGYAEDGRPGDSAYITDVDFTPGLFRYEDPLYCLDNNTGYLMYQWAIEEGIRRGYLKGKPFRSAEGIHLNTDWFPGIKAKIVPEPGNKSRVITVGEDWLTIFLQPLSHGLISLMRKDPSATSGLSRGWQGFDYVKAWSTKPAGSVLPDHHKMILSSDLKTATDYCSHQYGRSMLRGFIAGLGLTSPLTELWTDLLCSGRNYLGPVQDCIDIPTSRGVLMGDPGAKLLLSLYNKVAEMEAMLRFNLNLPVKTSNKFLRKKFEQVGDMGAPFRLFAFAGDDHVAIGPERYLREISSCHRRNGMEVSTSTNFISRIAAFYCEEIIFIGAKEVWKCWGRKIPLQHQRYGENPHVDALKIRLLSPVQKGFEGKNDSNPAIGRGATLRAMIAWFAEGWENVKGLASLRFHQRLGIYLPKNKLICGLPRRMGGLEGPIHHLSSDELKEEWEGLDIVHRKSIVLAMNDPKHRTIQRILSRFSTTSSARGVENEQIEEQVRGVLESPLCESKDLNEFKEMFPELSLRWDNLTIRQRMAFIENQGWISVGNAMETVARPYTFRNILFPEESLAHGIDPYQSHSFRQLRWPKRIENMVNSLNSEIGKKDLSELYNSIDTAKEILARDIIVESLFKKELAAMPSEVLMVPKKVVFTDSLCTLSTPNIR
nr:RNA-dependent RNA polymerase [Narnavirus sp.]